MKKRTGKFIKQEIMITICDYCGKELGPDYISYDYNWSDGYDTFGNVAEVCSLECLRKLVSNKTYLSYYFPAGEDVRLYLSSDKMKKLLLGE